MRALMKLDIKGGYFSRDALVNAACKFLANEPEYTAGIDALAHAVG